MKTSFVILFMTLALSSALELPKTLKTCRKSDPEYAKCLDDVIPPFIMSLASGMKSLNVLPIEPLAIDRIKIGENSNSPVTLKQEYTNVKIHGLTKGLSTPNHKVDFDKLIIYSDSTNPRIEFIADYEMDGKVLILPVRGKGRTNITMINQFATNTIRCEKYDKDGKTYLKVVDYRVTFAPEKVFIKFDNTLEDNKALGDQLNNFISENTDLIFNELKGSFEESFGLVFKNIANNILRRYPMMTLFPE